MRQFIIAGILPGHRGDVANHPELWWPATALSPGAANGKGGYQDMCTVG